MQRTLALLLPAAACAGYAPAFLWSEKIDVGLGHKAQHLHEHGPADLERALAAIQGQPGNSGGALVRGKPQASPEVTLVFLVDGLETELVREHGTSLENVNHLVQTSASSATVPFTSRSDRHATIYEKAIRVPGGTAEEYLAARPEIFTNGATDLLVIDVAPASGSPAASLAAQDALVGRVSRVVSRATNGRYAALVTGGGLKEPMGARRRLAAAATGAVALRIDRDLLMALLVSLLLIVIFLSGFGCLFSLQTPRKFDEASKAQ